MGIALATVARGAGHLVCLQVNVQMMARPSIISVTQSIPGSSFKEYKTNP